MASQSSQWGDEDINLSSRLTDFPNFLNLDSSYLTQTRLYALLHSLEEEDEADDVCEEESVFKLNFKSWIYFKLERNIEALKTNDEVIEKTEWQNMMSIANRVYLSWLQGKEEQSLDCLEILDALKKRPDFKFYYVVARAELAYAYGRIGRPSDLLKSMEIFEEVLQTDPQNYHWKLRLGLVYRRADHLNIFTGISKNISMKECLTKAVENLTDVTENCKENRLRGPAFAELAVICKDASSYLPKEECDTLFRNRNWIQLCNSALKCGEHNSWVLTRCGIILRNTNLDRAIELLEESLNIRKHTTAYHHLGLCFEAKAKQLSKGQPSSQGKERGKGSYQQKSESRSLMTHTPSADRSPLASDRLTPLISKRDTNHIQLPNKYFDQAVDAYEKAIETSHGGNIPAIYSLGLILKRAHQEEKAVEKFNLVTNYPPTQGYLITIISAYEQAGLCYLKMGGRQSEVERKLMKAISLAANLASEVSELRDCSCEIWQAFRTLKETLDAQQSSRAHDQKLIRFLELVKYYGQIVEVVQNMLARSDDQLDDIEFIKSGVKSYLELGKYENSLTFLNMASTRPALITSDVWKSKEMIALRSKVLILVCFERLQGKSPDARFVFQDLFKLHYGRCAGQADDFLDQSDPDYDAVSDVLFVYGNSEDSEDGLSLTSMTVRTLKQVFADVFGLDTNKNPQVSTHRFLHYLNLKVEWQM